MSNADTPSFRLDDIDGFRDSANHWRKIKNDGYIIQALPGQPRYKVYQVREIAANILRFQRANGGWPKDYDMLAMLTKEQAATVSSTRNRNDTSYDNHNIHPQVAYLAKVHAATREAVYRDACLRGLDFMLASQLKGGGFPQRWPAPKGYHAHITFNDGVMMGILNVLNDAARGTNGWEWLDDARREKAAGAVKRGIACILAIQYRQKDGTLTAWGQQHDPKTGLPSDARDFELACLTPQDTSDIVSFFMKIENPGDEIIRSVNAAVAWMERVRLTGIRVEKFKAPRAKFLRHDTSEDRRVVADPAAHPIWARCYEMDTNRPIFSSRDSVKKYDFNEMDRERRTGTPWFGEYPKNILKKDHPVWLKRNPRAKEIGP
ncbi:MAG: pectate lyase [Opitutaceae bacterium]|nr:pectate lyase [Opitutaceae bacterium]